MVSDQNRSKNLSKMKSPKSNGRSRRNKISLCMDQQTKSPKKEKPTLNEMKTNKKIKSGSWKRTTFQPELPCCSIPNVLNDINELAFPSLPTKPHQPAILYSDVLFSGEKLKTPVKIKNLTPRHSVKMNSRSRKRLISMETTPRKKSKEKNSFKLLASLKAVDKNVPKTSAELGECVNKLMKRLNIDIPAWNFEEFEKQNDAPGYICGFDDYNYLACENVALVGLRLASDGKFRY